MFALVFQWESDQPVHCCIYNKVYCPIPLFLQRYRTPPCYGEGDDLRFELESTIIANRRPSFGSDRRENRFQSPDYQRRSRSRSPDRNRSKGRWRLDGSPPWRRGRGGYNQKRDWGSQGRRFQERSRRWDTPPGERTGERDQAREQSRRERSPSPGSKEKGQRRDERSNSTSPSRRRRRRSRFDQGSDREHGRGSTGGDDGATQSKWARHRDRASADGSMSEEDRKLEMTYQEKERKLVEEQDVFGLDKIL